MRAGRRKALVLQRSNDAKKEGPAEKLEGKLMPPSSKKKKKKKKRERAHKERSNKKGGKVDAERREGMNPPDLYKDATTEGASWSSVNGR